ncbi:winged helix-turn-helix transcriptional regulator [Glycomyces harbinensis]|uniref:Transcriptional regulator, HxlR family n=1 Tax=Glycomyces harbinensis TaxID=58114 RepID=A0A1G7AAS5_9ACTN|nr:winged helix-turn-helix transcriptional regulator [Glycomyces harbinensis]SDE11773.1 transcriptional regulator, HxlR family [Glycomyces harbinensis]
MANREYHQYCGLSRAAEVVGQRWMLLILRDLTVGPRRYSDLVAGLPGIPTNLLSTRLKELEGDGLVVREVRRGADRSVVYGLTARGLALMPALDALSLWGAGELREPREGEIVTEASLVSGLRVAAGAGSRPGRDAVFVVHVGDATAHVLVRDGEVTVVPGDHGSPDLRITAGPRFRDFLAGAVSPQEAVAEGIVGLEGDASLLDDIAAAFVVPYADS